MQHLDIESAHMLVRGQLSAAEETRWLRHADECARCRELLANERSVMKMLELDATPAPDGAEERFDAALGTLPQFTADDAARWRRQTWLFGCALISVLVLSVLLVGQIRGRAAIPQATAEELHVSQTVQQEVVSKLDPLLTLLREPWVETEYETVRAFEQFVVGDATP